MDNTVPGFQLDPLGTCNFCSEYLVTLSLESSSSDDSSLSGLVSKIKYDGRKKPYDCIIGLSGGVDSSWTLVKAVNLGLRPLVVHLDNGWNSELTQHNIHSLVTSLDIDFKSYVINWSSYKRLMQSFLQANVVDLELLMDNSMISLNYREAAKYNIKYILAGTNKATEGMRMPVGWNWFKYDKKNISDICSSCPRPDISSLRPIGVNQLLFYTLFKRIKWISFLDYLDYNKKNALKELSLSFNYKPYPYKHYESILTRFYQGYILPEKFKIDKRRLHLSTLVISEQLSRDEALAMLSTNPYPSISDLQIDKEYFMKKLNWSLVDMEKYISTPPSAHSNFKSEEAYYYFLLNISRKLSSFIKT